MWTPVRLSCAPQRRRLESDPAIHRFGGVTGIGIEADFRTRRMRMDGVDERDISLKHQYPSMPHAGQALNDNFP